MNKYRVPKTAITEKGLRKLLDKATKDHASRSEWAKEHDITPQSVSAFMLQTQGAGLQIPQALGYRPQTVYLPVDEEPISGPKSAVKKADPPKKKKKGKK